VRSFGTGRDGVRRFSPSRHTVPVSRHLLLRAILLAFAVVVALLLVLVWGARADELPDAPRPKAHARFYDRTAKAQLAVEAGALAWDETTTCRNLARGGTEQWLPTQSCAGVVGYQLLFAAAAEGAAYLLHRTNHHKLERIPRLYVAGAAVAGIAHSKRTGAW
jgi:hypothetical protein